MTSTSLQARYSRVAVALHWMIAALVLAAIATGVFRYGIGGAHENIIISRPVHQMLVSLHMTLGASILLLSLARLAWRLTHRPPPLDPTLRPWERIAAHSVHLIFYGLMIGMPLVGTAVISSYHHDYGLLLGENGRGSALLWNIPWPTFPVIRSLPLDQRDYYHAIVDRTHTIGGYTFLGLILVHVAGALKHQFVDRHPQLSRMWFGKTATAN